MINTSEKEWIDWAGANPLSALASLTMSVGFWTKKGRWNLPAFSYPTLLPSSNLIQHSSPVINKVNDEIN